MNTYLLNIIGKFTGIVVLSTVSLFSINSSSIEEVPTEDVVTNEVEIYQPEINNEINETLADDISMLGPTVDVATGVEEPIVEEIEPVIEEKTYNGMLTGYGPDCAGCSGLGNLYCHTKEDTVHSLITDGIYYEDEEYGIVRILSADQREFPCGTIIEITNSAFDKELGIVLDTGSGMRNAYDNGWILIDLAFEKEALAHTITNKETTFVVKRLGF